MQVTERVHILKVCGRSGTIYPTLIHENDELVLVDTGYPFEVDLVKQAIADAGFSPNRLTYILLTHQDMDHIGCAKELVALSGAQVCAHEIEAPYIQGDSTPVKLAAREALFPSLTEEERTSVRMLRRTFDQRKLLVDLWLRDGEVLPICGGIEAVHTPGHTPGHTCFYVQQDEVMIVGDALNLEHGQIMGPNPKYTADMNGANASNQKLTRYAVQHVTVYHGGLFDGNFDSLRLL